MKKIILHWTAGTNQPCSTDYEHYHYLVTGDGLLIEGKYKPEDNENCSDGVYAQHTGGGNTGSVGIAMCGMANYTTGKPNTTKYPLTAVQCERFFKLIAEVAKKYDIAITPATVMTHYEFGQKNPKTTSYGKIDITYLHPYSDVTANNMGDFIRGKANWYLSNL
ncbi:MAG: N-acetylmuramoyl-L-alanine amidase [Candidatus Gastranaerophilales bacterium]|nr:N-acetylmuramoyl-L-alanine amidase [Candidatus Gastranaerophilales bacterium]